VRADEVVAVLHDIAGADARRVDVRTAAGLVRGGMTARWRRRPPLRVVALFRLLGKRPPTQYEDWLRDDLAGILYAVRELAWRSPVLLPLAIAVGLFWRGPLIVSALWLVTFLLVDAERDRRRRRRLYFGEPTDEVGHFQHYRGLASEADRVPGGGAGVASHPATAVSGSPARSVDSPPTPIATPHQGAHPWDESSST